MRPFPNCARACLLLWSLGLGLSAVAWAQPETELFPPLPDGRRELRDARDVAPYLAAWKAHSAARVAKAARAATANQSSYDAQYYDLDLTFTPTSSQVAGTVRMRAQVVAGPLTTLDLDFYANLVMDGATSGGAATTFTRAGDILTLTLDRAYANGEVVEVTVTYHGVPTAGGYMGFPMVNGRRMIWSLSEAYGARSWWPCKDAPEDKADSVDVHFTAPNGMITASNGTLVSTVVGPTTTRTSWRERYPIATYLVSIASYPYSVSDDWYRYSPTDSMLIRFHNVPESVGNAASSQAKVKSMLAAFATRYGEYPFIAEKYGHAEFTFGGGMEHQTCTSLGTYNESVVAHELAHQWWGDMITCRDFHHIWLNEGFATYGEALWAEANGGPAAYHADLALNRYLGSGTIWVPDATDESRVFSSSLSYNKASWVLHMLRHVLGDATFFQALQTYRTQWGYKSAVTEDFRDVCEAVSGRDLDAFFQQWIYGEYYPQYQAGWSSVPQGGGHDVTVVLQQTQSWQLFRMPVDITITTSSGETTFVVEDSLASQAFVLHVDDTPLSVQIDKDNWLLKSVQTVVQNPTFERGVLLVNGVEWATYGSEITSSYLDKAFFGDYSVDFWDHFDTPAGGYPATLPARLGRGPVPAEVLGHYRNVVWVGNNFNGDLASWQDTPILSYLRAGGNVLLLSRMGDQFLGDSLRAYLGINWTSASATLQDCLSTRPGFSNIATLGTQNLCSVFDSVRTTSESELLYRVSTGFTPSRGVGAVRMPAAGAGSRPQGGRFAFLSGRPYRWNHAQLKSTVMAVLLSRFLEPVAPLSVEPALSAGTLRLAPAQPNPFRGTTALEFTLPRAGHARLELLDVTGRRVRLLTDGIMALGPHRVTWDGRDASGAIVPAGLYWARLEGNGETAVRRLARLN